MGFFFCTAEAAVDNPRSVPRITTMLVPIPAILRAMFFLPLWSVKDEDRQPAVVQPTNFASLINRKTVRPLRDRSVANLAGPPLPRERMKTSDFRSWHFSDLTRSPTWVRDTLR